MVYRSGPKIIADLLEATAESGAAGIRTTRLLTKANVPHPRLKSLIGNLTGSGLVVRIEHDGTNTYMITERGRIYLENYRRFASMAESFGLEL